MHRSEQISKSTSLWTYSSSYSRRMIGLVMRNHNCLKCPAAAPPLLNNCLAHSRTYSSRNLHHNELSWRFLDDDVETKKKKRTTSFVSDGWLSHLSFFWSQWHVKSPDCSRHQLNVRSTHRYEERERKKLKCRETDESPCSSQHLHNIIGLNTYVFYLNENIIVHWMNFSSARKPSYHHHV